jgi:hypothetical protein
MLIKVKKNNSCEIIRHRSLIKKNDLETNDRGRLKRGVMHN